VAALAVLSLADTQLTIRQERLPLEPEPLLLSSEGEGTPASPMMAQPEPDQTDKKRVKVYELRNNDWFDRGTGFCTAEYVTVRQYPFSLRLNLLRRI